MSNAVQIKTISDMHRHFNLPANANPLITVVTHKSIAAKLCTGTEYLSGLYCISFVDSFDCTMEYGQSIYAFKNKAMVFTLPGQVAKANNINILSNDGGWSIAFHPDLLSKVDLGKKINQYPFFNYEVNQALKVTPVEVGILNGIRNQIDCEIDSAPDRHSNAILTAKLDLILTYCSRFYDRQFHQASSLGRDYVRQFDMVLNSYYKGEKQTELGVPTVQYFGRQLGISPYYLSHILKRETGMTALEYIHHFLVERAKFLISEKKLTITQVAYSIGFEYPQHFSRLFKAKTGMSPKIFKLSIEN